LLAVFCILLIGGSYVCYRNCGSDLLPAMDERRFIIDYIMPAGSSLDETNRVVSHVEQILRAVPRWRALRAAPPQLGLAAVTEANTGDISVKLKRKRSRTGDEVIADVRAKVKAAEPVLDVEFPQLLQDMIGDLTTRPNGGHQALLAGSRTLTGLGAQDWRHHQEDSRCGGRARWHREYHQRPATLFNVEPSVTARAGFSPQEVELDTSAILQGEPASLPVLLNDRAYTIRVRFPEQTRASMDAIQNTLPGQFPPARPLLSAPWPK